MNSTDTPNRILVIDDEPSTLNMLRLLLTTYGYEVLTAESGEKGLEIFAAQAPSIVLTDVRMPGMDGIEVLKRVKKTDINAEVIVVTGHGDMEMAIRSLQHDASDFINKPIQKQGLEVALRRAKERIELRRQLTDYTQNLETKVEEATADLANSYRQLNTLYEISQSIGEMATLREIAEFLRNRIHLATKLRCHGVFMLNGERDAILKEGLAASGLKFNDVLTSTIKDLPEGHRLNAEETRTLFRAGRELETEDLVLIPISREGESPVGAVLTGIPASGGEDDIRLVTLLLSIAAGAIRRAVSCHEEVNALRQVIGEREQFGDLIGRHAKMGRIFKLIATVADTDATVLILGESGTGKELIARRIHELSGRRGGPFVVINCAAFPQSLLESELFGHEKGAFTGAIHTHRGAFEQAHGGTIFLDEIADIPSIAQVKILRVIQFMEFKRVGSEANIRVDVRLLAATSKNLRQEIEEGNFREDLYYRLHVIPIEVPPLRERMSDLPLLVKHFLAKLRERSNKNVRDLDSAAMDILMNHRWPGNIRELENVMEHAFVLASTETIGTGDLPAYLRELGRPSTDNYQGLGDVEKQHLIRILKQCHGNKIQAARKLGISRSTLYRKLEQYGLLQ